MGFKIGNTAVEYGLMLAPMAGYTDRAMRLISREYGAEYLVTEMVSAKAIVYGDRKTVSLARICHDEAPTALQLFGSEPDIIAEAASKMQYGIDGYCAPCAIDINMGCPVNKIFSNGEGSALMRSPELIYDVVKKTSKNISLPVTVKIRAGIDSSSINAVECALAAEEGGAALVCIHGRTRVAMYSGKVDLEVIAKVKESLHIPVIANGDIKNAEDAMRAFSITRADGIMIGRGAVGNPFVFSEIKSKLKGSAWTEPDLATRGRVALRQLSFAIEEKGEEIAVRESRKAIALYLSDFRGAARLRAEINQALTFAEVKAAIDCVLEKNME